MTHVLLLLPLLLLLLPLLLRRSVQLLISS
jgi:hypothetical protein